MAFFLGSPPGAEIHAMEIPDPPRRWWKLSHLENTDARFWEVDRLPEIKVRIWNYRLECITPLGATYRFVG